MAEAIAAQISASLQSGDFETGSRLLTEYCNELRSSIFSQPATQGQHTIAGTVLDNLQSWLTVAKIVRSHFAEQLSTVNVQRSYTSSEAPSFIIEVSG